MDDIVVIIITILIAVVGVMGQRKKRKDMQAAGKVPPKQEVDFWELLREQSLVENDPFEHATPIIESEEEPLDTVPVQEPVYQFKAQQEGSSDIVETVIKAPKKKKRTVLIEGEKFSLRKAVIYSEIMNRKYI